MAEVSFMRFIFETTKESVEESESSIKDMITNFKKDNAGKVAPKGSEGEYGGKKVSGGSSGGDDALSTAQSLELQFRMGQYTQLATGATNMMKAIKDLLSAIMRNVG